MKDLEMFVWWFIDEITNMSQNEDIVELKKLIMSKPNDVESNITDNFNDYVLRAMMLGIPVDENITPARLMVVLKDKMK